MIRRRNGFWWVLAGPLVVLGAVLWGAFPFLAVTATSRAKVLVVEGWMDPGALQEAARLALDSGYTKIYTTGTVRPFAYYLAPAEGIALEMHDPAPGPVKINASGTTGAGFTLWADGDTLMHQAVTAMPQDYQAALPRPAAHLRIAAWPIAMEKGVPEIYVGAFTLAGRNANLLQRRSWFTFPDLPAAPAWPTYAQSARAALIGHGVPANRIIAVPAYGAPRSRSWGNAHAFGIQAKKDGITAFDLATVGVHARRSRELFRAACGPKVQVGVIALNDPFCTRANWWRSFRGWYTVMKEVVGAPEAQAVEMKR